MWNTARVNRNLELSEVKLVSLWWNKIGTGRNSLDYLPVYAMCHILFYNTDIRNYWWGLYFCASKLSQIYEKIKYSQIKFYTQIKCLQYMSCTKWCYSLKQTDRRTKSSPSGALLRWRHKKTKGLQLYLLKNLTDVLIHLRLRFNCFIGCLFNLVKCLMDGVSAWVAQLHSHECEIGGEGVDFPPGIVLDCGIKKLTELNNVSIQGLYPFFLQKFSEETHCTLNFADSTHQNQVQYIIPIWASCCASWYSFAAFSFCDVWLSVITLNKTYFLILCII